MNSPIEDKPSPEQIAFARMRRLLSDELAPYFVRCIEAADFRAFEIAGSIDTLGGGPRENALSGQAFVFPARIETADGESHEVELRIQHTDEWYAAVTVLSGDGGPQQTVIVRREPAEAIPQLKSMIDDAINKIRNT